MQDALLEVQESSLVVQEGERHFFDEEISNLQNAHREERLQALDANNERDGNFFLNEYKFFGLLFLIRIRNRFLFNTKHNMISYEIKSHSLFT